MVPQKGFMKAFFIKPFEAPQRSWKIKFKLFFSLRPGPGPQGFKIRHDGLLN